MFIFLVFSVYKNLNSNHHLLYLTILPDLEVMQSSSVSYICQVCKLYFILDMSKILDDIYIWVSFVNSESVLILAFVKYNLHSHCTRNYIFYNFCRLKTLALWQKIVQNLLIFVHLFCPKNKSRMVVLKELSDPSLNRIFNALSIGVQYTFSLSLPWRAYMYISWYFQLFWTNTEKTKSKATETANF